MPLRPEDELNLPDAPDFISRPPVYTAGEMARLCEPMLPHWNRARIASPPPPFTGPRFRLYPEDWADGE
ncbi:MAG: hypothetical protein KF886_16925 [Candidatus Hydrogenedentes bacterium]|nr:hypothetical protein [Candidatus Hydrogenedentota bacterium]